MTTPPLRIGSICTGVGGLDEGVIGALGGGELAWCSEIDPAASRILARRYPDVPNIGDLTKVDWSAMPPIDVFVGGIPCQPHSHAGKQRGFQDERAVWRHVADGAIATLRPRIVIIENVRGLLSLGFDLILADLHRLGYDVRWTLRAASEVGAPHQRLRLFIVATDRDQGGSLVAPEAVPFAAYGDGGWIEPAAGLFGEVPFEGRIPNHGALVGGELYALPNPVTSTDKAVRLPTPAVNDMGGNKTVEWWDDWIVRMKALGVNANGHGKSLGIELQRVEQTGSWGEYETAIERWAQVVGRPAPMPTTVEYGGRKRSAPALVEWMMGLPAGLVSGDEELTVPKMLVALGNGVVPQQAAMAVRWALSFVSELAAAKRVA